MKLDFNSNTSVRWLRIIAIVLAIVGIGFGYWASQNKAQEIQKETTKLVTQNKALEEQEAKLDALYNHQEEYKAEKDRCNKETEELLAQFPTYMYIEDKILYADTLQKGDLSGYNLKEITYGDSQFIMNTTYGDSNPLELYKVSLSSKFTELSYLQLRTFLDYGLHSEQRFVVDNVQATFSAMSGSLTGQITFSTYFIPGQTDPYVFPQEVIDALGQFRRTDDLFGTFNYDDGFAS